MANELLCELDRRIARSVGPGMSESCVADKLQHAPSARTMYSHRLRKPVVLFQHQAFGQDVSNLIPSRNIGEVSQTDYFVCDLAYTDYHWDRFVSFLLLSIPTRTVPSCARLMTCFLLCVSITFD